ncbi:hypothetical protein HOY82DRAFT_612514 [Tuber indicum]|nr:hypothetical protein HOY82DRAFT_612514 [Tuber indicum]
MTPEDTNPFLRKLYTQCVPAVSQAIFPIGAESRFTVKGPRTILIYSKEEANDQAPPSTFKRKEVDVSPPLHPGGLTLSRRQSIAVVKQAISEATSSAQQMFLKTTSLRSKIFITAQWRCSCRTWAVHVFSMMSLMRRKQSVEFSALGSKILWADQVRINVAGTFLIGEEVKAVLREDSDTRAIVRRGVG